MAADPAEGGTSGLAVAAFFFYLLMGGVGAFLSGGTGWEVTDPVKAGLAFLVLTGGMLLLRAFLLRFWRGAREMERELSGMVGRVGSGSILLLAICSGVGEEIFFREWLQSRWGLWGASAVFGAVHWPATRALRWWPFFAFGAGLAFGAAREWTGNLVAPVLAHTVYNGVSIWCMRRRSDPGESETVEPA